jgi:hypothetical protein
MTKRTRMVALLVVAGVGVATVDLATSVSAATVYGPSWGRFSINFPSTPAAFNNTAAVRKVLSGYSSVYVYTVASPSDAFALPVTAKPPAFWVVVAKPGPKLTVTQFMNVGKMLTAAKRETIGGLTGYIAIFPETTKYLQASVITDKNATEGLLFTHRGTTLYLAEAVGTQASAVHAFLFSFRPAS